VTADQFFEHDVVQFPLERGEEDFEAFVERKLGDYVDLVRGMSPADDITTAIKADADKIEGLCRFVKEAIREYLRGLPHLAYARLHEGILSVLGEFQTRIVTNVTHQFLNELYRMRQEPGGTGAAFDKGGLFHIPFDLRHQVTRQRYSIPGLPCLYLGGSVFICWEELGRPSFESIHLARFQVAPGEHMSVLDFMARPKHVAEGVRRTPDANDDPAERARFHGLAVVWPLMATASIRRKHGNSPFIAEYIIPQLILQWILDEKSHVDGIAYSSVRCKIHVYYPAAIANLVFPAKAIATSGYCSTLRQKFALTPPVAWHLLARVGYPFATPSCCSELFEFVPGHPTPYLNSEFCTVEGRLRKFPAAVLA
jgi:hypothetical protein